MAQLSKKVWSEGVLKSMEEVSDSLPEGKVVGGVIKFSVADGYAHYRVAKEKPLVLEYIDVYGYRVSPALIRGLRLAEVKEMLAQSQWWAQLVKENAQRKAEVIKEQAKKMSVLRESR